MLWKILRQYLKIGRPNRIIGFGGSIICRYLEYWRFQSIENIFVQIYIKDQKRSLKSILDSWKQKDSLKTFKLDDVTDEW